MNWSAVSVQTPPGTPPVTTAEAKAACRILHSDDDAEIDRLVLSAVAEMDGPDANGIALMEQTWRLTLDAFPGGEIVLPGWPIKSVTSVNYKDTSDVSQTFADFRISLAEPVRIEADAWPSTSTDIGSVWIDYVVGESAATDIPADLFEAVRATVMMHYDADTYGPLEKFVERIMGRYRRGHAAA